MLNSRFPVVAIVVSGFLVWATGATAAPYTDHFDALIVELQARAVVLSNSTDKVEQKQFKAIQKVLKTLLLKESTSLRTDLKNAGKVTKTLIKAFPAEFTPPPVSAGVVIPPSVLETLLQDLFNQFNGDETALLGAAQAELDALPDGICKDTAQATLDDAAALLASTSGAPDFVALAAILNKGFTVIVKSEGSVAKAIACVSKGSGGCAAATTFTANAGGTPFVAASTVGQWTSAGGGPGSLVIGASAADGSFIGFNLAGCACQSFLQGLGSVNLTTGTNAGNYGWISGTATISKYQTGSSGPACGSFSGIAAENSNPTNTISVTGEFTVLNILLL